MPRPGGTGAMEPEDAAANRERQLVEDGGAAREPRQATCPRQRVSQVSVIMIFWMADSETPSPQESTPPARAERRFFLDINMPRLGGIEALTAIRAIAPAVKVIMVSGQSDLEVARRALAYGAFDYVAKSFDPGYLWLSVEAALASKGLDAA